MKMRPLVTILLPLLLSSSALAEDGPDKATVERGKYLVKIAGCNDCHTPGYAPTNGQVPEPAWLIGDSLGWNGPWGTSYAINLRKQVQGLSEAQWVQLVQTAQARPPMPWYVLHQMTGADLKAMYQYIRSLGPSDNRVPEALPPGQQPPKPYYQLVADPPPGK